MKRRRRQILNKKGLTLVEVIVAITILLMAAEIIAISVSFTARMNTRSQEIFSANEELGKKIMDESEGDAGTMEMEVGGAKITNSDDGKLYSEASGKTENGVKVRGLWADDAVMADLFAISGAEPETISDKPELNTLPNHFPQLEEQNQVAGFYSQAEDGGIVFNNGNYGVQSHAEMDGIAFGVSGSYTASGVAVLEINSPSFTADRVSVWFGAEIYRLSGTIECSYSDKYKEGSNIPIHLYLIPDSGHGQPALVYVEEGTNVNYNCYGEDTSEVFEPKRQNYTIPTGWYAIPAGSDVIETDDPDAEIVSGNARDLLKMTKEDWLTYSLTGKTGEIDKAYARLIMAGVIDKGAAGDDHEDAVK